MTKPPTIQPINPAFLQFSPRSSLLNTPTGVPAYSVLGSWGSTVRNRTIPPSGPTFVHSLTPAQTVPGSRLASNIGKSMLHFIRSNLRQADRLSDFIVISLPPKPYAIRFQGKRAT